MWLVHLIKWEKECFLCQVSNSYKWTSLTFNKYISLSLLYYICTKGDLCQKDIFEGSPTQTSCHFFITDNKTAYPAINVNKRFNESVRSPCSCFKATLRSISHNVNENYLLLSIPFHVRNTVGQLWIVFRPITVKQKRPNKRKLDIVVGHVEDFLKV